MRPVPKFAKQKSGALTPLQPDLYSLSQVQRLLSVGEYKLAQLLKEGHFTLKDIRGKGAVKPLWRVTRASYKAFLRSKPDIKSSAMIKRSKS